MNDRFSAIHVLKDVKFNKDIDNTTFQGQEISLSKEDIERVTSLINTIIKEQTKHE